jgi:hypothetical protein
MRMRRVLRVSLFVVLVPCLLLGGLFLIAGHRVPEATPGPDAEALARSIEGAIDKAAWERTGAVRWTFSARNVHLWDRRRHLDRVRLRDGAVVLIDLNKVRGRAYRGGQEVTGAEAEALVKRGYAAWVNDSFWLNPLAKLQDPGVERLLGRVDGRPALLIRYRSGGLTPGDQYLWLLNEDGVPRAWRMWVSILPIGGLEASWEDWQTLSTGARVATLHRILGIKLVRLTDVAGAESLAALEPGPDPFAPLFTPPW